MHYDLLSVISGAIVKPSLSICLLLLACANTAQAASFDCVAPVFPAHSTSKEGVRRIEKQVRQWRACNATHRSGMVAVQVDRLNTEVEAGMVKWIAATRAYANGQFNGRHMLTQMEHEKAEYGMWMRGTAPANANAPKL